MNRKRLIKAFCPVDFAFKRIGGKYKGRIIWFLKDGTLRYGELRRKVEGISTKMLTQALKELEEDEIIKRKVFIEIPPHVEYSLTDSGFQLVPSIDLMRIWAIQQTDASLRGSV
ncbi:MAG: winged helix-turn-helix transcriptional regulator [Mucilaginibacter sp.]